MRVQKNGTLEFNCLAHFETLLQASIILVLSGFWAVYSRIHAQKSAGHHTQEDWVDRLFEISIWFNPQKIVKVSGGEDNAESPANPSEHDHRDVFSLGVRF